MPVFVLGTVSTIKRERKSRESLIAITKSSLGARTLPRGLWWFLYACEHGRKITALSLWHIKRVTVCLTSYFSLWLSHNTEGQKNNRLLVVVFSRCFFAIWCDIHLHSVGKFSYDSWMKIILKKKKFSLFKIIWIALGEIWKWNKKTVLAPIVVFCCAYCYWASAASILMMPSLILFIFQMWISSSVIN